MITKLNKFNKKLLLTSILLFTWFILTVNSVYCMPTGHKKNSRQSGIRSQIASVQRPGDTPLTPSTTRDREHVREAKLKTEDGLVDLEMPLKGYKIKLNWRDISGKQSCPEKIHKVLTVELYHPDNVFPKASDDFKIMNREDLRNPSSNEESSSFSYIIPLNLNMGGNAETEEVDRVTLSADCATETGDAPDIAEADIAPNIAEADIAPNTETEEDISENFAKVLSQFIHSKFDEISGNNMTIIGFTDQPDLNLDEIPFKIKEGLLRIMNFVPVKLLAFRKNKNVEDFEEQASMRFVTWDHEANGYIAYPNITKLSSKSQKQFKKALKECFEGRINEDGSIEVPDNSVLHVLFDRDLILANYSLCIEGFRDKLRNAITRGFRIPYRDLKILI